MSQKRGSLPSVLVVFATIVFCHSLKAQTEGEVHRFRMPHGAAYRIAAQPKALTTGAGPQWLKAWPANGATNWVELGSRLVLQLQSPDDLPRLIEGRGLKLSRTVTSNIFILQAADAPVAAREANRLAALPEVTASYPVMRRHDVSHGPYAAHSNDPFFIPYFNVNPSFDSQWPLENIEYDGDNAGKRLGVDLNVLAAWPYTEGQGVTVAVADSGLDMGHVDLSNRVAGAPHYNFATLSTNQAEAGPNGGNDTGNHSSMWAHATSVAGLIAAEANNGAGMAGVAPQAKLASWLIYDSNQTLVSDERLMDMYQYAPDTVAIQNHSWGGGNDIVAQVGPTLLEKVGIGNAVTLGRNGLGTVLMRSAGNDRGILSRADDDAYPADPNEIAVGAVFKDGRVANFSEPGACVLVAAPGGNGTGQGLFALDLTGDPGVSIYFGLLEYRFGTSPLGFAGTSAATPFVSGIAALMMSANTNLGYRDVQQILALSARQWDTADPDIVTNGAGFLVSHNQGFGIPNAGQAVTLARSWTNRPALTTLTMTDSQRLAIPDAGLRLELSEAGVPAALSNFICMPSLGPNADTPTASLPLVYIGQALSVPVVNLTNKGALIARGGTTFEAKINNAAAAGAAFAVVYNYPGDDSLAIMVDTDFTPIPAVFVGNSDGVALQAFFQANPTGGARIHLTSADKVFHVNSTLLCEQVGVRVQTDHPLRGSVRITLLSPMGTRSVLQRISNDNDPGPVDWTYWTTHDFFESSAGDWTVSVSDEGAGSTGAVRSVSLTIRGTQITDTDHDGLDDGWETARLGSLAYGPKDDLDNDSYSNAREQLMGTNPQAVDVPLKVDLNWWSIFQTQRLRLSWPAGANYTYQLWGGTNLVGFSVLSNLAGTFPEDAVFLPHLGIPHQFFGVKAFPVP